MLKPITRLQPSDAGLDRAPPSVTRRQLIGFLAVGLSAMALAGCKPAQFHSIDIAGGLPPLAFTLTRASDGKQVTQADYRGEITLLYFGYTFCPDVCPTTLTTVDEILRKLGPQANRVRVLFVTVDPNRDTLPVLADYVANFGPRVDGLRGTPDQIGALTRRYRVVHSVEPATKDHPYEVTHSSTIYVFDGSGAARLLVPSLASPNPDVEGTAADLKRLIDEAHPPGLLTRLISMV
jgi:protein SCO1